MIRYHYRFEQLSGYYRAFSKQFPQFNGFGTTEQDAVGELLTKIDDELNRIIKAGETLPVSLNWDDMEKGDYATTLSLTQHLKMYLHAGMLEKKVTRAELAKFLAFEMDEVDPMGWEVEKLRKATPAAAPKHKKVQRLLDIKHPSTINEISEAFHVLDYMIDFTILSKFDPDAGPVLVLK